MPFCPSADAPTQPQPFPAWLANMNSGEAVLPRYEGQSLVNVPATLAQALGSDLTGMAPPLRGDYIQGLGGGISQIVLVLLDALGYRQLQAMVAHRPRCVWSRLAENGLLRAMTSVFPSTTATALTSLMTGAEPLAHGLLGYELWLREYGVLTQMLQLKPALGPEQGSLTDWGLKPEEFIPVASIAERLRQQKVKTTGLTAAAYFGSGLSRMLYRGFDRLVGYRDVVDMWSQARQLLDEGGAHKSLLFVYWGEIDAAIHAQGSSHGAWERQFDLVTEAFEQHFLEKLTVQQRRGTALVLCADHGWVDTPIEAAHDVDADAILRRELLIPYSGEARAAFLHLQSGGSPESVVALREALGDGFCVVETQRAVESGLFGLCTPGPESLPRLGHALAIARGQRYLDRRGKRFQIRGRHGGLTPDEMLIPWLAARLDA